MQLNVSVYFIDLLKLEVILGPRSWRDAWIGLNDWEFFKNCQCK